MTNIGKLELYLLNHPNSSLSCAIRRMENIFDEYDEILFGFSGGKDSSLTAQLAIRELKIRQNRVKNGSTDILDKKWENKKLWCNIMHPEWIYTDVADFTNEFIEENMDYLNVFYKCLELGWSSSITFQSNRIVSWDRSKESQWIQKMPKIKNLDIVTNQNILTGRKDSNGVPNYGLGYSSYLENFDCWTFPGQDEDFEQETFSSWFVDAINKKNPGYKVCNLISIRAEESMDRRKILSSAEPLTGKYGFISSINGNNIDSISPIFDMKTKDIWRSMNILDFKYCKLYDLMFESGIPMKNQRIASLLNVYASNSIQSIKSLEPNLYQKIVNRFDNVELIGEFSTQGYYKAFKPKDMKWNGKNHIKAGVSDQDIQFLNNRYEDLLRKYRIDYKISNNMFFLKDEDFKKLEAIEKEDKNCKELNNIHFTWKDYTLYLLNNSDKEARENWQEKMVTDILKHRFQGVSSTLSAYHALKIMSELPQDYVKSIVDQVFEENIDWKYYTTHSKSKQPIISFLTYPMESVEKMCQDIILDIVSKEDIKMLNQSRMLKSLTDLWQSEIYNCEEKRIAELNGKDYNNYFKDKGFWGNIEHGAKIYFKENMQSSSSYKKFCIAILKNDMVLTYLKFTPTYKERLNRLKVE